MATITLMITRITRTITIMATATTTMFMRIKARWIMARVSPASTCPA
jgi:hypothetical protein